MSTLNHMHAVLSRQLGHFSKGVISHRASLSGISFIRFNSTSQKETKYKQSIKTNPKTGISSKNFKAPIQRKVSEPTSSEIIKNLPEHIRKSVPGETTQSNSLLSRLPRFPLRNTKTLIARPGVPTAATASLRSMMEILNKKTKEELIYEAEPHRLYFLVCGVMAFIFTIYGLTFIDWGFRTVWDLYKEDDDLLMLFSRFGICSLITAIAVGSVTFAFKLPTRLVRRMWYVPGSKKQIKFTTHPILPGNATPIHTIALDNLVRSHKSKVFTRTGAYGTVDKATFFFLLKDQDRKFGYWMVDRNGWFWGDGRVFDVLFGKETLQEAEKGQPEPAKKTEVNDKNEEDQKKKKEEEEKEVSWNSKDKAEVKKKDLKAIFDVVSKGKVKD